MKGMHKKKLNCQLSVFNNGFNAICVYIFQHFCWKSCFKMFLVWKLFLHCMQFLLISEPADITLTDRTNWIQHTLQCKGPSFVTLKKNELKSSLCSLYYYYFLYILFYMHCTFYVLFFALWPHWYCKKNSKLKMRYNTWIISLLSCWVGYGDRWNRTCLYMRKVTFKITTTHAL